MTKRVLVANRGEIACRVIRSCRRLGLEAIAVYSDADRDALHVALADRAIAIGPPPARDSYLSVERLLDAARVSGADAIHPGYGFLSENAEFADAVVARNLIFVGPSPASIRDMGDKGRARELAQAACVPVVPGSSRFEDSDLSDIATMADAIGYPLLVKAAAGGGGIGMRRVDDPAQLGDAITAARSMAAKAFGNSAIYLERYIANARHVEIQVFGFGDGRAIHLFERDCSAQRRFQKVVEESPAPGLPDAVRDAMADAAVRLCGDQRYDGAGTIEFVVDADTLDFYFLEMNTRIQVEHPVTEMITGRDLVAMQLEHALGLRDVAAVNSPGRSGHAIECRLYAENPAKNFMPAPGPLPRFELPAASANVRIDTGFRAGDDVTIYYDPLVAKVICRGDDRAAAIACMRTTLEAIDLGERITNLEFLRALVAHPDFAAGRVTTTFIDRHRAELVAVRPPCVPAHPT